jgi:hypothetical protein
LLSTDTAVALFNLKISPVATYGIQLIWQDLMEKNLKKPGSTKAMFHVPTRLAYALAGTTFFTEDIEKTYNLPEAPHNRGYYKRGVKSCHYSRRVLPYRCHANGLGKTKFKSSAYIYTICYPLLPQKCVHKQGLP